MGSPHIHTKKSMPRLYRCKKCNKSYAVEWALANHIKHCVESK